MNRREKWREKARAYRDFGMAVADQDLRHALFTAAEVYTREAERVEACGRLLDPSPFTAAAMAFTEALAAGAADAATSELIEVPWLSAADARDASSAAQEFLAEADGDQSSAAASPLGSAPCETAWDTSGMDAGYVRQQAAKYRKRAGELSDPVASLALLSLALTCERLARDIEVSEARRCRAFQVPRAH